MQEGMPQVDCLDCFSDMAPHRVELFCIFCLFGAILKKQVFPIDPKSRKIVKGRRKARPNAKDPPIFASWVPWPANRATELVDRRLMERGKRSKLGRPVSQKKSLRDLTRLWARGPANMFSYKKSFSYSNKRHLDPWTTP